ncbi:MAG: hypothetical protein ACE5IL_04910 [Myxococcota bacterium]
MREVLSEQSFGVFAFSGEGDDPPYTSVMFFAETPGLEIVFCTGGSGKLQLAREGSGACVQIDNREIGLDRFTEFTRVTVQGKLHRATGEEQAQLLGLYVEKLPQAETFLKQPGLATLLLRPQRLVFSRGFAERFELEFPNSR